MAAMNDVNAQRKLTLRVLQRVAGTTIWQRLVTQVLVETGPQERITVVGGGGGKSLILVSTDGGKHFEDLKATVGVRTVMYQGQLCGTGGLRGILREGELAYVCGENGLLARSTDGCRTFEEIDLGQTACFQSLVRADDALWLTGDPGLWRSTDEGASWHKVDGVEGKGSRPKRTAGGLLLPSTAGRLYRSRAHVITPTGLRASDAIWGACETPTGTLIAVGAAGAIWRSTDAGESFHEVSSGTKASLGQCVANDSGRVVVVGDEGTILVSDDDGESFRPVAQRHTTESIYSVTAVGGRIWLGGPGYVFELLDQPSLDELFTTRDPLHWLEGDLSPLFPPTSVVPLTALEEQFGAPLPALARMQSLASLLDTETCWEWSFRIEAPTSFGDALEDDAKFRAALTGLLNVGSHWNGDDIYLDTETGEVVGYSHEEDTFDLVLAKNLSAFAFMCMAFAAFQAGRLAKDAFHTALERVKPHVLPSGHFTDADYVPTNWGRRGHYAGAAALARVERVGWMGVALGLNDDVDDVADVFVKKLNPKISDKQLDARLADAERSVSDAMYGMFRAYLFQHPERLQRWFALARTHTARIVQDAATVLAEGELGKDVLEELRPLDPDRKASRGATAAAATATAADAPSPKSTTYLELAKGKTRDFWQIQVDGDTLTITSGVVGGKKPPKEQTKTLKSAAAAAESAAKEIAKKKAAFYFDPSSIEGILEAHVEQLEIPTEADVQAHREALPHASEDYFRVYRSGALGVGFLSDFAPGVEPASGEFAFGEMNGLFGAYSATDELDEDAQVLDAYFYVVGTYPDGSAVLHYNAGKHAGRLGLIEHGLNDELVEHVVEGDPDATIAAWSSHGLIEPVSKLSLSEVVRRLLLHYKAGAVARLQALRAALETVRAAVSGDPLQITELTLNEKGLRALPEFLGTCENLEVLALQKNELTQIPPVLRGMKKLRVLDLYCNAIDPSTLPAWLSELPLTELNLSINTSRRALAPVVSELVNLQTLRLPTLNGLPASFGKLVSLRHLAFDGVKGTIEIGALGPLERLELLNLGSTGDALEAPLPEDLGGMKALQTLKFDVTPKDAFPLPASITELRALRVLHAGASTLTDAVCELAALEELRVSGNAAGLPERFGALTALRTLDLRHGRMSTLPASFGELARLEHLNLEASAIESLPASFAKLTALRFLAANVTAALDIGELLAGLENLEHLKLTLSVLRTVRGSLRGLRKLERLDVYTRSEDEPTAEMFELVRELPALKILGAPYALKDQLRAAFPHLTVS